MTVQRDGRPFLTGWRLVALNVLSASTVAAAVSAAVTGSVTTQVVLSVSAAAPTGPSPEAPAAATVVVLGGVPLRLPWPAAGGTAFVDLVAGSTSTSALPVAVAAVGVPEGVGVFACGSAWTKGGTCRSGGWRLPAGRLEIAPGQVAHLRLSPRDVAPARASIVVALGTGPLETVLTSG